MASMIMSSWSRPLQRTTEQRTTRHGIWTMGHVNSIDLAVREAYHHRDDCQRTHAEYVTANMRSAFAARGKRGVEMCCSIVKFYNGREEVRHMINKKRFIKIVNKLQEDFQKR